MKEALKFSFVVLVEAVALGRSRAFQPILLPPRAVPAMSVQPSTPRCFHRGRCGAKLAPVKFKQ